MTIAIDLDETIFECNSIIYKIANAIMPPQKCEKKLKYNIVNKGEKHKSGILCKITKIFNKNYYSEIENATDVIKEWYNAGIKIVFLSSRPAWRALKSMLLSWLEEFDVPFTFIAVSCNNKAKFCEKYKVDILIDDFLSHCVNTQTFNIFSIYYNRKKDYSYYPQDGKGIAIAKKWKQISEHVLHFIKDRGENDLYTKLSMLDETKEQVAI